VQYDLPTDFGELSKVVSEYPVRQYNVESNYKWEGYNQFLISYDFEGEIRIIYNPIPIELTAYTDEIPVNNPISLQFIIYYVAAKVAIEENPNMANFFEQKANELKFQATKGQPAQEQRITDVYFTRG
jgi:hypothetical protein